MIPDNLCEGDDLFVQDKVTINIGDGDSEKWVVSAGRASVESEVDLGIRVLEVLSKKAFDLEHLGVDLVGDRLVMGNVAIHQGRTYVLQEGAELSLLDERKGLFKSC